MAVTIERMREISAAFNSRDVARIVDCFAEDGVFCLARGPESVGRTLRGKAAIRRALTDRLKQIPDMAGRTRSTSSPATAPSRCGRCAARGPTAKI
jgi:ketosteroid isomerase-like protein